MRDEFLKNMEENENLLFCGISNPSKTSIQLLRFVFCFVVLFGFWMLFIDVVKKYSFSFKILVLLIVLSGISILAIYGFVFNLFSKFSKIKDEYFVTNKKIAIYNSKTGFKSEYIENIKYISISREKENYGDIIFFSGGDSIKEQMKNKIVFKGAENPRIIANAIEDINKKIYIVDDRISIFGNKI